MREVVEAVCQGWRGRHHPKDTEAHPGSDRPDDSRCATARPATFGGNEEEVAVESMNPVVSVPLERTVWEVGRGGPVNITRMGTQLISFGTKKNTPWHLRGMNECWGPGEGLLSVDWSPRRPVVGDGMAGERSCRN